ncbi:Gene Transfer Agent prohead protease [hydrothermal vent metagenome]|uniref:Gene Transfer Agent prohead protease n=1 Tax=hydrothermal vent metagenome TaxID=652676 RepID=A0A3B0S4P6_9ZZZZ
MNETRNALVIEGYASLFFKRDLAGDTVLPGAFASSVAKRGAKGIRMLFQHDADEPVGVWEQVFEDENGLFVRGTLTADGPRGRTALALARRGSVDGLSIGFRTRQAVPNAKGRELTEIDLWEVSIVTFPMLPQARFHRVGDRNPAVAGPLSLTQAG